MSLEPLAWLSEELATLESLALRRTRATRGTAQGATIEYNGRTLINFGSNDYLGLAASMPLERIRDVLDTQGWGSGASPLITGRDVLQVELERALADFEQTEAAILFPTGFAANLGTIPALASRGDLILSDAKNHASLIDGCRLSGARVQVYPHADPATLEKYLAQAQGFRRRLIVTDSLFSMDGDCAPLVELVDIADRYDAMLLVDEAHATGVFGEQGRGLCEHFQVEDRVPIRIGTISKALGSIGGFVVGSHQLIDWLANRARPYVFSTAPPAALAAAGLTALEIVRTEPERRRTLLQQAAWLRRELQQQGWQLTPGFSQIIPLQLNDAALTMQAMQWLLERGLLVPGIRPPTVPVGESLLRISLSVSHQPEHLQQLLAALSAWRSQRQFS
ncbi:MAG: 8-amino-7-oxononanoate synthase [Planctomycetota bacterium]